MIRAKDLESLILSMLFAIVLMLLIASPVVSAQNNQTPNQQIKSSNT